MYAEQLHRNQTWQEWSGLLRDDGMALDSLNQFFTLDVKFHYKDSRVQEVHRSFHYDIVLRGRDSDKEQWTVMTAARRYRRLFCKMRRDRCFGITLLHQVSAPAPRSACVAPLTDRPALLRAPDPHALQLLSRRLHHPGPGHFVHFRGGLPVPIRPVRRLRTRAPAPPPRPDRAPRARSTRFSFYELALRYSLLFIAVWRTWAFASACQQATGSGCALTDPSLMAEQRCAPRTRASRPRCCAPALTARPTPPRRSVVGLLLATLFLLNDPLYLFTVTSGGWMSRVLSALFTVTFGCALVLFVLVRAACSVAA